MTIQEAKEICKNNTLNYVYTIDDDFGFVVDPRFELAKDTLLQSAETLEQLKEKLKQDMEKFNHEKFKIAQLGLVPNYENDYLCKLQIRDIYARELLSFIDKGE